MDVWIAIFYTSLYLLQPDKQLLINHYNCIKNIYEIFKDYKKWHDLFFTYHSRGDRRHDT